MVRLSNLGARLGTVRSRLDSPAPANERERSALRRQQEPWKSWYGGTRWQKLRAQVRVRDRYTCGMCKRLCTGKGEAHVDHKVAHRGNKERFYDESNLWVLCSSCHNSRKQSLEAKEIRGVWY
jgi:5-methylcytosine-specific restriction protein A